MEPNYVIILDLCGGYLNIIKLTDEGKYGFRLKDCQWMTTETLNVYRYENGIEI